MGLRPERHAANTLPVRHRGGLLTAGQRGSLERDGYVLVPLLLDEMVIGRMRSRLDRAGPPDVAAWEADPSPDIAEPGVVHAKLGLADPDFAPSCEHPLLAEAATAVFGHTARSRGAGVHQVVGCAFQEHRG